MSQRSWCVICSFYSSLLFILHFVNAFNFVHACKENIIFSYVRILNKIKYTFHFNFASWQIQIELLSGFHAGLKPSSNHFELKNGSSGRSEWFNLHCCYHTINHENVLFARMLLTQRRSNSTHLFQIDVQQKLNK